MNYEYKTWLFHPLQYKTFNVDKLNPVIEEKINEMADSGWEYMNSITAGGSNFAFLVFRRAKD